VVAIAHAQDLPIDINAIRRNETRAPHQATRAGIHLFSDDATRINEAQAQQIRQRQATASYLFAAVSPNLEPDPHMQIITAASGSALFANPTSISNITPPPPTAPISMWLVIPIIAICAIVGFIWALKSSRKKKGQGQEKNVY